MTLHPTMKRRLHERLHPLIGEEEADALLDEISPADPVTREWLQDRFDLVTERFAQVDRRLDQVDRRLDQVDERFAQVDHRFEQVDQRFAQLPTKEWIEDRFVTKEHLDSRLDGLALDTRFESQDHKREGMEHRLLSAMHQSEIRMIERLRQQIILMVAGFGGAATIISVSQAIWG